jgi:hypothetical protein
MNTVVTAIILGLSLAACTPANSPSTTLNSAGDCPKNDGAETSSTAGTQRGASRTGGPCGQSNTATMPVTVMPPNPDAPQVVMPNPAPPMVVRANPDSFGTPPKTGAASTPGTTGPGTTPATTEQGTSGAETGITASIRKALAGDTSLSHAAKNVSVVTAGNNVSLKGNVATAQERQKVEAHARKATGVATVDNQLAVKK